MILKEITLENFRQFYGKQKIIFADGEENITIIFGENGKGKTGIFRALMFGLYGSTHIEQDNPRETIHLVNFIALEKAGSRPVEASVQVKFEYKGKLYELLRKIVGIKTGEEIRERTNGAELYIIDELGNYSAEGITDELEIKRIINGILDETIKDFFLFDAEKIETLTKTDKTVREEVKNGIIKLLHIDKLEEAINLLKSLHTSEKRKLLQNSQNLDLKQKEEKIQQLTNEIGVLEECVSIKEENQIGCAKEIGEVEAKLAENEDVRKIQEKYQETLEKKNYELRLANVQKDELKKLLVEEGSNLQLKDVYPIVKNYINQVSVNQQDLAPIEVLEASLNSGKCAVCGTNLDEHHEHLRHVQYLKDNYRRSNFQPVISLISQSVYDFNLKEEETMKTIHKKMKEFREIKNNINELDRILDNYQSQVTLKAQDQENLSQLESTLHEKKAYLQELRVDIEKMKDQVKEKEKEKEQKEKEFSRLLNQNESLKVDAKVLSYIENLKDHFQQVFKEYSDEMRQRLTEETTSVFKLLIDSKDKGLINKVDINEKYEIKIFGWDEINITQDLSQGQRQVVALSFITSLAKVASGGRDDIAFPLFMDTPFGRISGTNRDQLIQNLPKLSSQWILLLTDTEFTRTEELQFKVTGKLGRWYKLDQIRTGYSKIVELDTNEMMATRG